MRQVEINGVKYTELDINTNILLDDESLDRLYQSFHAAKVNGAYSGSFTGFCTMCLTVGANVYLTQYADIIAGCAPYSALRERGASVYGGREN